MDWFYCEEISEGRMELSGEEFRHLKVKREKTGDSIILFDGAGNISEAKIISINKGSAILNVSKLSTSLGKSNITIATAIPKGKRTDVLLQKLTELGVSRIIPMKTRYSVVDPGMNKQERWKKILIEACKQCHRSKLPILEKYMEFKDVVKLGCLNKIILDPSGNSDGPHDDALILIGPEGGFSDEELLLAEKHGFRKVKINDNILRVETAAIAAAAIYCR